MNVISTTPPFPPTFPAPPTSNSEIHILFYYYCYCYYIYIYIKSIQSNWYFLFERRFGDSHLDINNLSGGSSLKKTDFLLPLPLTSCWSSTRNEALWAFPVNVSMSAVWSVEVLWRQHSCYLCHILLAVFLAPWCISQCTLSWLPFILHPLMLYSSSLNHPLLLCAK